MLPLSVLRWPHETSPRRQSVVFFADPEGLPHCFFRVLPNNETPATPQWVEEYIEDFGLADRVKLLKIWDMSLPRGAAHRTCNLAPVSSVYTHLLGFKRVVGDTRSTMLGGRRISCVRGAHASFLYRRFVLAMTQRGPPGVGCRR